MAVSARHAFNVKQSERKQCFVVKVNRFSSRLNQPEASGQQELIKPPAVKLVGSPLYHLSRLPPTVLTLPSTCPTVISNGAVVIFAYV